ncbi:MAG: class I SAM-dependent methyltransferase [Sphingobacteriales bacterium]|nr:MAG: class I SAM-dependent methyltransferase [Sphingobacteriales bacterium]TAF79914.1 MAG: class I SAM-dependent methyltransferase [Sphingobacteriales bacterium]
MINFHLITNYLQHVVKAKTLHGVHSPFVYQLLDKVIYNFKPNADYVAIENLRQQLLNNKSYITVTDFGAGSHINNNTQKQIKQIAKNALKPAKLAQLIYRLVKHQQPNTVIELGTCLGLTTAYMAKAAPNAHIISMEGCPKTANNALQNLQLLHANNVSLKVGDFNKNLPSVISENSIIDVVFIDGNHQQKATIDYFNSFLPHIHHNSLLIFDDIYWSKGMKNAWEHIKQHPQVSLTIDLFWIGLVFFIPKKQKENFKIRF